MFTAQSSSRKIATDVHRIPENHNGNIGSGLGWVFDRTVEFQWSVYPSNFRYYHHSQSDNGLGHFNSSIFGRGSPLSALDGTAEAWQDSWMSSTEIVATGGVRSFTWPRPWISGMAWATCECQWTFSVDAPTDVEVTGTFDCEATRGKYQEVVHGGRVGCSLHRLSGQPVTLLDWQPVYDDFDVSLADPFNTAPTIPNFREEDFAPIGDASVLAAPLTDTLTLEPGEYRLSCSAANKSEAFWEHALPTAFDVRLTIVPDRTMLRWLKGKLDARQRSEVPTDRTAGPAPDVSDYSETCGEQNEWTSGAAIDAERRRLARYVDRYGYALAARFYLAHLSVAEADLAFDTLATERLGGLILLVVAVAPAMPRAIHHVAPSCELLPPGQVA